MWGTGDTLEDFRVSLELEVVPKGNGGQFLKGRERREHYKERTFWAKLYCETIKVKE